MNLLVMAAPHGDVEGDLADRLVSATVGTKTETYTWSGDGVRLSATSGNGPSATTRFQLDRAFDLPQLALERDGNGKLVRRYSYGLDLLAQTTPTKGPYWYHHDGLGSVTDITSATGSSLAWWEYQPYGLPRAYATGSQAPANSFLFTGAYFDQVTALYHLRARQYDPSSGRFLSTDPVAAPITDPYVGAYVYVRNNPCRYVDPSGLAVEKVTSGACPPAIVAATLGLIFVGPVDALIGLANIVALPSVIAELALLPADVAAVYATGYLTSILQQAMNRPCEASRPENPLNPFGG